MGDNDIEKRRYGLKNNTDAQLRMKPIELRVIVVRTREKRKLRRLMGVKSLRWYFPQVMLKNGFNWLKTLIIRDDIGKIIYFPHQTDSRMEGRAVKWFWKNCS